MATKEKIIKGYIEFQLLNGRKPYSVFELTKKLKIEESAFYELFPSLEKLQQSIPLTSLHNALHRLEEDEQYPAFSAREKLLSLFFTLFEELKEQRSFYLFNYTDIQNVAAQSKDWKPFLEKLQEEVDSLLSEAKEQDEIKDRAFIGEHYAKGYKLIFTYIFRVWLKDESSEFSTTDAAIEKAINLSFDLLGSNQFDSILDFGKFAFKTKVM